MGNHVIGATLTLRDNMSATLRGVRREQSAFRQDVQATQRTLRQRMEVRLDATAATRTISRVRTAIEPLRSRIVTAVAIRDNAARERRRIRNEMNALGRQAIAPLVSVRDSASRVINGISSKLSALKGIATGISIGGVGVAAGAGFALNSGAQLEQQQISMEHFIGINNKDKSATDVKNISGNYLKDLRENSNATPFGTSEVIGAGTRALGVTGGNTKDAMDLVKVAEDMAALTPGKTVSDAMEALADAKNGEMERLKEFNAKVSAEDYSKLGFKGVVDTRLKSQFEGGAAKLSTSGAGLASTVKGKLGSSIQDTGLKMLEKLKPAMTSVIGMIDKYSPQMEKFGLKIADGIGFAVSKLPALKQHLKDAFEAARPAIDWLSMTGFPAIKGAITGAWEKAEGVYNFFKDNWPLIGPFVKGVAIAFGIYKGVMMAAEFATIAVTAAQLALNFAMNANPIGLIILGIGLLIGAGIALYQNWDVVKQKAGELWEGIKSVFSDIGGWFDRNVIQPILGIVPDWLKSIFSGGNSNATISVTSSNVSDVDGSHANGLDYVPFDGYIAKLHKGERVQTASENPYNGGGSSSGSSSGGGIVVHMNGTVIREEADVHKIATAIVYEIKNVSANMA